MNVNLSIHHPFYPIVDEIDDHTWVSLRNEDGTRSGVVLFCKSKEQAQRIAEALADGE